MLPRHIGIIMDGNGRWAKAHGKSRNYGHQKGADALDNVVETYFDRGVEVLSFYAFSTENWKRPKDEVDKLMSLMSTFIDRWLKKLVAKKVKLVISGDITCLAPRRLKKVENAIEQTKTFTEHTVNICFNYGSRDEIVKAVNKCVIEGKPVTEESFNTHLYTADLPDVDLVIRTSGEQRLSNFLLWQSAYAELYFTPVHWPDFNTEEIDKSLAWYNERTRRFGKTDEQLNNEE